MPSIAELPERRAGLDAAQRSLVAGLYRIEELEGDLEVPEPLRAKAARWCGGGGTAPEAWRRIQSQRVISVHSTWTFETANFNVLRTCRPVGGPQCAEEGPDQVAGACQGPERCDFCDLCRLTCVEPFGRIRGRHACTAGNAFKSSGLHGLVVWNRHHPHKLSDEEVLDGFVTADTWFARAIEWEAGKAGAVAGAAYPFMFWNCFRSGGASQIHPHMQLQLFRGPVAHGALLHQQSVRYRESWGGDGAGAGDLLLDIVSAHRALGLALDVAGAACWASLTPRVGGGELCVLTPRRCVPAAGGRAPLAASAPAVAAALRALRRTGAEGISVAALPAPAGGGEAWLVRCSARGRASPGVADAGSAELVGVAGVGADPYALFAALQAEAPRTEVEAGAGGPP